MKYTSGTKPGMGDPYWYEWSVGLKYVIQMLNPDNGIEYVELQADVSLGLDDVVITYSDGAKVFIQVKHTRAEDSLTFGDLVSKESSSKKSLLQELATGWNKEKDKYTQIDVLLFTNRLAGKKTVLTRTGVPFRRPALATFLPELKDKVESAKAFEEIQFPDYAEAWNEWVQQLECIDDNYEKLRFLKCLKIETNNSELPLLQEELLQALKDLFQTNDAIAEELLKSLDHALRQWSTSNRKISRIDKEEVYSRLSIIQEYSSYNQDLVPSNPFFPSREKVVESIEDEIRSDQHKIVFLSGVPGIGKTNIISKLNAKRESLIDIRYYAYEPIDPTKEYFTGDVCRRVDKDYFWNELFNQLRRLLKGQLFKYRVPVINDLMTLEQKRTTFFRIASEYANDRGKAFVIAIDGIDHAARATNIENTFLPTLPDPEYIPTNVLILLAGQPKSNYQNYPSWLFANSIEIKEINVPPLQSEDIRSLVDARFSGEPSDYRSQLSELISRYAEGNTLAAIFAVHEAIQEPTLFKLERVLQERHLSGNIQTYYETIWNSAIQGMQALFVDYKVAGVFAFLNEPINERKLYDIYSQEQLSVSDWRNILKALHPLLSEEAGNYTFLHNDVRVFLSNIIGQDQDHVQEVYSNLLDYYLALPEKNKAYYHDMFRFMKASGRLSEFEKAFSPEFIIEAYVNGVELDEIHKITTDILREIIASTPIDWVKMRSLAFGYITIDQLEKSQYEIDSISFRKHESNISIHPYECYVEPVSAWNDKVVSNVLSLTEKLYNSGLVDRANALFKHWFSGMSICKIYEKVELSEDSDYLSPATEKTASRLGVAISRSGEFSLISGTKDLAKQHPAFVFHLNDAAFEAIIKDHTGDDLQRAVGMLDDIHPDSLIKNLLVLLTYNRLTDIYHIDAALGDLLSKTPVGTLFSTAMKILSLKADFTQEYKESLWKQIEPISFDSIRTSFENENAFYSMYAIVAAYLQPKTFSSVADAILDRFMKKNSHKDRPFYGMYFSNVCLIGKWLSERQRGMSISIRTIDLQQLLYSLFLKEWSPNAFDYEIRGLRSHLLKAYIFLSKTANSQIRTVVDDVCEQVFAGNPYNPMLDAGFYYYMDDPSRQRSWYENWLGTEGHAWKEPIADRNSIIHHFTRVLRLYDINRNIDPTGALERARWSVIGYASHKEYACDYLLKWYNGLVEKQDKVDPVLAMQIKKVSDQTEALGDNRFEYLINSKVFEDIFSCGFKTVKETLLDNHYLFQVFESPEYFVDGLIGFLKNKRLDQASLLKIWAMGMAVLDWRIESNQATIHALQRAIELCAEQSNIKNIYNLLQAYGPAYVDLVSDPTRFIIPERWCDERGEIKEDLVCDSLIIAYMDGEKMPKDSIAAGIELLIGQGKIDTALLLALLEFELDKEEYEISRNPIICCLIKRLPSSLTDPIIARYLCGLTEKEHDYVDTQLPAFAYWRVDQSDYTYAKSGIENLIAMFKTWTTAAGHYQEPEIIDGFDYVKLIDWEPVVDMDTLFYQIIKTLILSEDADAARTALSGLFMLERLDESYIDRIERDWSAFHYRAKEWLLMTYELLWDLEKDKREKIQHCLETHCSDEDFNVALYANLLLENANEGKNSYKKATQSYFSSIPASGGQRLIRVSRNGQTITGSRYVEDALLQLESMTNEDCSDIEGRAILYAERIDKEFSLIPLKRQLSYRHMVTCDKIILSFLRVLYKDWALGRWDGLEGQIARVILSASEPYALLITPCLWAYSDHKLIADTGDFIKQPNIVKKNAVRKIIEMGIHDDEAILAGSIREYTYNSELFGFYLTYLEAPGQLSPFAAYQYERNSRFFLQRRADFWEDKHHNVTLHHNGVESFQNSNISCSISKTALHSFDWTVHLSYNGFTLHNAVGDEIGHFECFYAFKDISSRYPSCQPILQRWIIKKSELALLKTKLVPLSVCTVVDCVATPFK